MTVVDEADWDLSGMRDRQRAERLLRPILPDDLVTSVASEAVDPYVASDASWRWQSGDLMVGCSRAIVVIPVTLQTFDDLFNGRCGYRAQYHLSISQGENFNLMLVNALRNAAKLIFDRDPKSPGWSVVERSLLGPQSKIWVYGDNRPFAVAPEGEFTPRRWAHRRDSVWLRAPLPDHPAIDLKGTWLADKDQSYRIDPLKADRGKDLHERGFA